MTYIADAAAHKGWAIQWNSGCIDLPWVPFVFCDSPKTVDLPVPQGFRKVEIPEGSQTIRSSQSMTKDGTSCFSEEFCQSVRKGGYLFLPETPINWLDMILSGQESSYLSALRTWIKRRHIWHLRRFNLDLSHHPVMGIWNVDPESFSSHCDKDAASIEHAMRLIREGADILDVGAESTRPGAGEICVEEEIRRLSLTLPQLSEASIPISLDSRHAETIHLFLEKSMIDIVNDIGGSAQIQLNREQAIYRDIIDHRAGLILMAWEPHDSESLPFTDCLRQIVSQLYEKLDVFFNLGGDLRTVVVDPGIGFGKGMDNDFRLIFEAPKALMCLGCPVLIAHSRKRCLTHAFGLPVERLDIPTAVTAALTLSLGASLVRVHNVAAAKETILRFCQ